MELNLLEVTDASLFSDSKLSSLAKQLQFRPPSQPPAVAVHIESGKREELRQSINVCDCFTRVLANLPFALSQASISQLSHRLLLPQSAHLVAQLQRAHVLAKLQEAAEKPSDSKRGEDSAAAGADASPVASFTLRVLVPVLTSLLRIAERHDKPALLDVLREAGALFAQLPAMSSEARLLASNRKLGELAAPLVDAMAKLQAPGAVAGASQLDRALSEAAASINCGLGTCVHYSKQRAERFACAAMARGSARGLLVMAQALLARPNERCVTSIALAITLSLCQREPLAQVSAVADRLQRRAEAERSAQRREAGNQGRRGQREQNRRRRRESSAW